MGWHADFGAFDALHRVLRSRGAPQEQARKLYAGEGFREEMKKSFSGEPAGRLIIPTLEDALERIAGLVGWVAGLEQKFDS